jgi:hypothetical protein
MEFNTCFFAAIFYVLPLYCFFYLPFMLIVLPLCMKALIPSISWAGAFIKTLLVLGVSISLLMIVGLYFVGFIPFDCFYYLRQSLTFSLLQLGTLTLAFIAIQSIIVLFKKSVVYALCIANGIAALSMLTGYYVLFLRA